MTSSPQDGVRGSHAGIWLAALVLVAAVASALLAGGARSASPPQGLIAFTRDDGDIYLVRATGGETALLARVGAETQGQPQNLEWSPDGSRLVFQSGYRIWVVDADGTGLLPLTGQPRRESGAFRGAAESPSWSPDGRRIAYTFGSLSWSQKEDRDVWVMNADGRSKRRLARTLDCAEYLVDWSPKGGRVVTRCDAPLGLTVMSVATGKVRSLLPSPAIYALDWAPDGRRIVLSGFTRVGSGISVIDAESGSLVRLTGNASSDPSWSPAGSRIAFARTNGRIGIFVMKPDGTRMTRLTSGRHAGPAWQPVNAP